MVWPYLMIFLAVLVLGGAYLIEALVYEGDDCRRALLRSAMAFGSCYLMVHFDLVVLPLWLTTGRL